MRYRDYKEIPTELRRVILEETNETRVKHVSIHVCNEIIEEYLELQKENEKLKAFTVEYVNRNGNTKTVDLRNKTEEEIRFQLHYLFSEKGKAGGGPIKSGRRFTKNPSIQGGWRPGMWDAARAASG